MLHLEKAFEHNFGHSAGIKTNQSSKVQMPEGMGGDMFKLQIDWPTKDMLELLLTLYLRKK